MTNKNKQINNANYIKKLVKMGEDKNLRTITDLKKFLNIQNKIFKRHEPMSYLFYTSKGIDLQLEMIKDSKSTKQKLFCARIKNIKEDGDEIEIQTELRYCLINIYTGELQWN
jgi:hypothetical protein